MARRSDRCQSVRARPDHGDVLFLARLICSDADCAEVLEQPVATLAELDALACDCGCTWELLAVSLDAGSAAAAA